MTSAGILTVNRDSIDSLLEHRYWDADMSTKVSTGLMKEHPYSDVMWDIILHKVETLETTMFIKYDNYARQIKRGLNAIKVYKPTHWAKEKTKSILPELTDLEHMFVNGFGASLAASYVVSQVADSLGLDSIIKNDMSYLTEVVVNSLAVGKQFYETRRRQGWTIRQIVGDGLGYLAPIATAINFYVYQEMKSSITNILVDLGRMDFPYATVASQVASFLPYAVLIEGAMGAVDFFQKTVNYVDEKYMISKVANAWGRVADTKWGIRNKFRKVRRATSKTVDYIYDKFSDEKLELYKDKTWGVLKETNGFKSYSTDVKNLYHKTIGQAEYSELIKKSKAINIINK